MSIDPPSVLIMTHYFNFETRKWNIPSGTLAKYIGPKQQTSLQPGSLIVLDGVSDGPEETMCSGRAFYSQENPNWWGNEQGIDPIHLVFVMTQEDFERIGIAYNLELGTEHQSKRPHRSEGNYYFDEYPNISKLLLPWYLEKCKPNLNKADTAFINEMKNHSSLRFPTISKTPVLEKTAYEITAQVYARFLRQQEADISVIEENFKQILWNIKKHMLHDLTPSVKKTIEESWTKYKNKIIVLNKQLTELKDLYNLKTERPVKRRLGSLYL